MVEINLRGDVTNHRAGRKLNHFHIKLTDLECLTSIGVTLHGTLSPNYRW